MGSGFPLCSRSCSAACLFSPRTSPPLGRSFHSMTCSGRWRRVDAMISIRMSNSRSSSAICCAGWSFCSASASSGWSSTRTRSSRPVTARGLDAAHQVQADQLGADDAADAVAGRAGPAGPQLELLGDALAVDLHQAVRRRCARSRAAPVGLHRLPQHLLDLVPVLARAHVDEVHDHQPADVAQPQLPADLGRGLEVGVAAVSSWFARAPGLPGVDVDRGQRLGVVDDDRAAARQLDGAAVDASRSGARR